MQGFVFMSFILISLFNTRFCSHLISFHFFFFNKKIKQIKYYAISHLTFCCVYGYQTFFGLNLLAIVSRNVGTKGHLRKEIVLLKYKFFRFMTKSGGQFELLNWVEKSKVEVEVGVEVGGLWYCSFYHPLGWFQNWVKR